MEYTTVTYKVPMGYESQFDALVERKIEAILSEQILQPTNAQKSEFASELTKAKTEMRQ